MGKIYEPLFEAIREKCQREHWFGADLDESRWRTINQDFDAFDECEKQIIPVDDHPRCFGFAFPPASKEQIQATESQINLSLPPLLKAIYTSIANGGFGPGVGFWGIVGGYGSVESGTHIQDTETLVDHYTWRGKVRRFDGAELAQYAETGNYRERISKLIPYGMWWHELLPICDMGCVQEICVDSQERVFVVAPTEDNEVYWLRQLPWTLEEWLWRWVKDEDLLEQYPLQAA